MWPRARLWTHVSWIQSYKIFPCVLQTPLSAVDSHVGKHIFDNVIGKEGMIAKQVFYLILFSSSPLSSLFLYYDQRVTEDFWLSAGYGRLKIGADNGTRR